MKPAHRRSIAITVCVPGFLFLGAVGILAPQFRQENLDRALIAAVKRRETSAVLALLRSGANPNAVERHIVHRPFVGTMMAILRGDDRWAATWRYPSALMLASGCSDEATNHNS